MKYYLIAGEASGDLHASLLMQQLRAQDPSARFRCIGGPLMQAQGATLLHHYKDLAYMGILPVALHLGTILRALSHCKDDIQQWHPDALILVDYPGFNLRIAKHVKARTSIPVFYYIAPKLWAWKERRIHALRRDVDHVLSILPFEVDFFQTKHGLPVTYVGNPTLDEVHAYLASHPTDTSFRSDNRLDPRPIIALLPGSRRQEIADNLPRMAEAAASFASSHNIAVATAPGIEPSLYESLLRRRPVALISGQTYRLLRHSDAALVTSGTATLETALFRVPQLVCYNMKAGWLANLGQRLIIKAPHISLVNLIASRRLVPELVGGLMTPRRLREGLSAILPQGSARDAQLRGYEQVAERLGLPGAPARAAASIIARLRP